MRIERSRRSRLIASLGAIVSCASFILHSAAMYETIEPKNTNATHMTIYYGWPLSLATGTVVIEPFAMEARQHWKRTSEFRLRPVGFSIAFAVLVLLTFSNYNAILWFCASCNARISVATLLGLVGFLAIFFASSMPEFEIFERASDEVKSLMIEAYVLEWNESIVWMALFITCLWLPNQVTSFRKLCQRNRCQ